ncbi:tetratricopeptide repeat-containing sensor histidine kinase [Hymenobacter terricola]|uniref:tetratricopeptide repeat-containing sensor histidine kinase n=1 Tax=Hymenobacter terricola TaxID=2819236 RepID=UPI001B303599|nr:ATP-binding protein [Hymenobacter terricola]
MRLPAVLLLLSLAWCALPTLGQTPRIDSLRRLLRTDLRADTVRVRRLQALAQEWSVANAPQATRLSREALALARQLGDVVGEGRALLDLSKVSRRQADYEAARRYAQQAKNLYARHHNRLGLGRSWLQLSLVDLMQGNSVPALASSLKGLALAEQTGDVQTRTRLQATMGSIYYRMGNYNEALPVLQAALKNGQELGDQQLVLMSLNVLGNSFQMLKKWPQAVAYYHRALRLSQQVGDVQGEVGNETSLAEVYGLLGNQPAALAHGLRARQLAYSAHDEYNLPSVELMLARAYVLAHQTDSALVLAHHGLRLSLKTRSNENIRNASDILAQAYAQRGDFARAYHYRNLHLAYNDTLSGEDTQRRTSALRYSYELEKKQTQIALLTKTRQLQNQKEARRRQQLHGLLAGLVGVLLLAGLLLRNIFLKQRANRHLNEKNVQIAAHRDDLNRTLTELKTTQNQLVQREKMASLGELTAGVAHEMQNPLNFVTNFSDLSVELMTELKEELAKEDLSVHGRQMVDELLDELSLNHAKIHQHSHRADRIVKSMLEHSRASSGQRQAIDLNGLADESLRLAYHGWLAKHKDFHAQLISDLDPATGLLAVVPQDISRVLLNLLANAFYALAQKSKLADEAFRPEVCVQTKRTASAVLVRVRDNGTGIPPGVVEKIFQPFFTTKPTGEGTGLGLSLSYDIITKGHGGTLSVESREGEFTEFTVSIPVGAAGN